MKVRIILKINVKKLLIILMYFVLEQQYSKNYCAKPSSNQKLKTSFERRKELELAKTQMKDMKETANKLGFNKKKERVLRNAYRYGILGVDDPINGNSDLYKTQKEALMTKQIKSQCHLAKRQRNLAKNYGVSEQIEFSTNSMVKRQDKMHHEISPFWSRKRRVAQ